MAKGGENENYYFDQEAATRAVKFFEKYLVHTEGEWAGQPFILSDVQREKIIEPLFGWRVKGTNLRRYTELFAFMARGGGKSSLATGIGLYLTFADNEPGAQVYAAAGDKAQAGVVFDNAKKMVLSSPQLASKCEVYKDSIYVPRTGSVFKVISSVANTKQGLSVHGAIIDELHVHPNEKLFDVLQRGTRSRRQPLIVSITTAGDNLQSFCYQKYQYAKKVLSGAIEADWFLPVIFEADEKQDIYGEEAVKAANPNYPISPKPTYIQQRQALAKSSPMEENNYKRYNLNIWLQGGADKYLRMDDWLASDTEKVDWRIIEERMKGKTCYGGLDLGLVNDLSALVLIFPIEDTFVLLPYFWMPDFEMHKREPYGKWHNWVATGMVRTHVGNTLEYDLLRADIKEICSKFNVKSIAFDKQFSHQISQQLMNDRINMEQFAQYPSYYNEPMRKFLELILKKKIKHGNNEVMNWMAGNLEAITDSNGKIMPKRSKRKDKIDGMAASIMALAFAMNSEVKQAAAKSIYESRGVILI